MRTPKFIVVVAVLAFVAALTVGTAARGQGGKTDKPVLQPGDYTYTTVDVPGATRTAVYGINSLGAVAGRYMTGGVWHGFTLDEAGVKSVDFPGAFATTVFGISTRGDVAGTFTRAAFGRGYGFVLADGVYEELQIDGDLDMYVYDINDSGTVLGRYTGSDGDYVNFLWRAGEFTEIPITGVLWAEGYGLNDRGQVVGHFVRAGDDDTGPNMRGFLFDHGTFTEIPRPEVAAPPADQVGMSCLQGISDTGVALGHLQIGPVAWGYTFQAGRFTGTLGFPGASGTYPHGMSPSGVIAGYYVTGGVPHGFIAKANR